MSEKPKHEEDNLNADPVADDTEQVTEPAEDKGVAKKPRNPFKRPFSRRKKILLFAGIPLILLVVALAVPFSRYAILGLVVSKDVTVQILDNQTNKPVSDASVTLGSETKKSDNQGKVRFHAKVGQSTLKVEKKYYKTTQQSAFVPLGEMRESFTVKSIATGRQVVVSVEDRISGKSLENVTISAAGTKSKTDKDGKATLVLPADKKEVEASLSKDEFNSQKVTVKISAGVSQGNAYQLVPSGKVYFLSNQSGKLDVVKTNLDGSDRQTVLAGTGKEGEYDTDLLMSPSRKYLSFKVKRDTPRPSIYVINTANDTYVKADEGDAQFNVIGWAGDYLVYHVNRYNVVQQNSKQQSIKSFNADDKKLTTIEDNRAESLSPPYTPICFPACQEVKRLNQFSDFFIVGSQLVYSTEWTFSTYFPVPVGYVGAKRSITSVNPDASNKKVLKEFDAYEYSNISLRLPEPKRVTAVAFPRDGGKSKYYEYADGKFGDLANGETAFNESHPAYYVSPSGKNYVWQDNRDGKNAIFVSANIDEEKSVAQLTEYSVSGWYNDNYLLLVKNKGGLYVMPSTGLTGDRQPLKISDFHILPRY